jgi:uncharacterized damage-inducible protein DinB
MMSRWTDRRFDFDFPAGEYPRLLDRLKATPDRLATLVTSLPRNVLVQRDGDAWSIQENVGHLEDVDELFIGRLEDYRVNAKTLRPADMSGSRTYERGHNDRDIAEVLRSFRGRRERYLADLATLPADAFARSAWHPRLEKPMRLCDMLFFQAEHDDHHLAWVAKLIGRFAGGLTQPPSQEVPE